MAMQPILENGEVVDEYDDDQSGETIEQTDLAQEQAVATPLPPDTTASDTVDGVKSASSEQALTPVAPSVLPIPKVQKEDPTDFDQCDVSIQIMLHRADGDPQGRLVSIIVHNFSGTPVIEVFREADLTDKSRLDSIHRAIYPLMQRFLFDLSGRQQKKLEEEAKRAAKPVPLKTVPPTSVPPVAATQPVTTHVPALQQPSSSVEKSTTSPQTSPASKADNKKKDKQTKYQTIPMF